jgi:hypothetical protein
VQLASGLWLWLWRHALSSTSSIEAISDAPRGPPSDERVGGAVDAMELLHWFDTGSPPQAVRLSRTGRLERLEQPERVEQYSRMGRVECWWLHGMWC